jgi:hypothetical protein
MKTQTRRLVSEISETERREMIEEYLKGGRTKVDIWRQYTGQEEEHGKILKWMRQLGYLDKNLYLKPLSLPGMPAKDKPNQTVEELQQKIKQLEQQLLDSQLKEEGYRRMIDIAEKELKISIRKKPNTK